MHFAQFRAFKGLSAMGQLILLIEGATYGPWSEPHDAGTLIVIAYDGLTLATLKQHLPDSVVMPLFGRGFDAQDALVLLAGFGFAGRVAVTSPALPNPDLITRELSSVAPGITVTLVQTGPLTVLSR